MSGRFWGLTPTEVMVELSPVWMLAGLAEQVSVGGSMALTWNAAEQLAFW